MKRFTTLVLTTILTSTLAAQTLESADTLNTEEKFAEAVVAYRAVIEDDPSNGGAWYGLGRALQSLRRYDEALAAFDRAGELGFQPGGVLFRKGTIYLEKGEIEQAKTWLKTAAENGVPVHSLAKSFPSFDGVREDESFETFLESLTPCMSAEHRQFDFWIGDWDVYSPAGQKVGENTIEKILGGCVIFENWEGSTGGVGKSFNRFDAATRTWNQHWVFNNGSEMILVGTFEDGRMILETPFSVSPRQRWTWYEIAPGKVRQKAEQTTDGENWSVTWDSIYIPKGTPWEPVELD